MNTRVIKAAAGCLVVAAALLATQDPGAAAPLPASAPVVTTVDINQPVASRGDYRRGYRAGYTYGYNHARAENCGGSWRRVGNPPDAGVDDHQYGFQAGYNEGYAAGERCR
ncbi:hypothetical protein [Luedemannella helvata]|uniref:Uncharacterized protein n=1 Tax=Luedemannella helvata TaxID=349315 RepID=A0ABP4WD40_9ACTN